MRQPIKWHGGKHYLAKNIVELMPPRCKNPNSPAPGDDGWLHYVEPYFGGGAVLLAHCPEGISEVVNDIHRRLINFWYVLADPKSFVCFSHRVNMMPCSEEVFGLALRHLESPCDTPGEICAACATAFFVVNRQSRQALGKDFATLSRNRTRRGMNELAAAWLSSIEGLPEIHERLKRVVILNRDALDVIRTQDGPRTLFYLDPPYLPETREATDTYEHEMTYEQHEELLWKLGGIQGRFLLSGYHSDLYDCMAKRNGWRCKEFKIDNKAGGGKEKRTMTECVWMNY